MAGTEVCGTGDNDCDGRIDEMLVCTGNCTPTGAEVCNGADDGCDDAAACTETFSECSDTIANDGDGLIDCDDDDCDTVTACFEAICDDGNDNDADGQIDCADDDCLTNDDCIETGPECADTTDNDGDGQIDCADTDCAASIACSTVLFSDDFEAVAFNAAWTVGGDVPFELNTAFSNGGLQSARSGTTLGTSQISTIEGSFDFAVAGAVSFSAKVSSEACCDELWLSIDGNDEFELAGEIDWMTYEIPVPAGTHTLQFRYDKDGSVNTGMDAAWIDDVMMNGIVTP